MLELRGAIYITTEAASKLGRPIDWVYRQSREHGIGQYFGNELAFTDADIVRLETISNQHWLEYKRRIHEKKGNPGVVPPGYFTLTEAARYIGVSRHAMYNWIEAGRLSPAPVQSSNGHNLYRIEDVENMELPALYTRDAPDGWLDTGQIVERFGVSIQTAIGWCRDGILRPAVRCKEGWMVAPSALDGFVPPSKRSRAKAKLS